MNYSPQIPNAIRRRLEDFQRRSGDYGELAIRLASHAALPVVLDPPEELPYTAEVDLLMSPLCREIGGDLYEMEPELRNVLLELLSTQYAHQVAEGRKPRSHDVATLLWQYVERYSPWVNRPELERAQQLTALHFLEPARAMKWMEEAEEAAGRTQSVERAWFVAMRAELQKLTPVDDVPKPDTAVVLHDFQLPDSVKEIIIPPLAELGFTLKVATVIDTFPEESRAWSRYSFLENGVGVRVLLYISPQETNSPSDTLVEGVRRIAIDMQRMAPQASTLYVISEGIEVPGTAFVAQLIAPLVQDVRVRFIPWSHIEDLRRPEGDPQSVLIALFDLEEILKPGDSHAQAPIEVFCSYSPQDKSFLERLEQHLRLLSASNLIDLWSMKRILPEMDWKEEILDHLESADIFLLLLSPDYFESGIATSEMKRALERHDAEGIPVIPILLRPVHWSAGPLGKIQALPTDARPITEWRNRDEAFRNVARGIQTVVERIRSNTSQERPIVQDVPLDKRQAIEYYQQALSSAHARGDKSEEALTLRYLGETYSDLGETNNAIGFYQMALVIFHELNDTPRIISTVRDLGRLMQLQNRYEDALNFYRKAQKEAKRSGDREALSLTYCDMGQIKLLMRQYAGARNFYRDALEIEKRLKNSDRIAVILFYLAGVERANKNNQEARSLYHQALAETTRAANSETLIAVLRELGEMEQEQGNLQEARGLYHRALSEATYEGKTEVLVVILRDLVNLAQKEGDLQEARSLYYRALEEARGTGRYENFRDLSNKEQARGTGNSEALIALLRDFSKMEQEQGNLEEARSLSFQALNEARSAGNKEQQANILRTLGDFAQGQHNYGEALQLYSQALDTYYAVGDLSGASVTLTNLGRLYGELGDFQNAIQVYERALTLLRTLNDQRLESAVKWEMALLFEKQGDLQLAMELMWAAINLENAVNAPGVEAHVAHLDEVRRRVADL
jgi:tetratricopeptide (TPR) repeat protein